MQSATEQSCLECAERPDRHFCALPVEVLKAFDVLKSTNTFPRGTILFREGTHPKEIFVLCEGRARLSVCSAGGRRLTLRLASMGEVLGLSACLAGTEHAMTAELLDNAQVATVKRKGLMHFLRNHGEACMQVVNLLSQDLHYAYDRVRAVGMGKTRHSHSAHVH